MTHHRRATRILLTGGWLLGACVGCGAPSEGGSAWPLAKLVINELQPSNHDTVTDELGEADDWIEIFNAADIPVDMVGFTLADSSGTSQAIPVSLVLPAGAFRLFWADDSPSQGASHLGFKLSASAGDSLTLKDSRGRTLDAVSFGPATGQSTYARFPDGTGTFVWCAAPTPGASNGSACAAP